MATPERIEKLTRIAKTRQQGVVVLEDIFDPHNAEAVFRSCDAFGFQRVCLIFKEQKPFNPQAIGKQSSSSANKWLNFEIYTSTEECLTSLKNEGMEIVATILDDTSESIYSADLSAKKIALMLGNERDGLSEKAISMADRKLIIPMMGLVQSFNLSVTASMCLFEITRQRIQKGIETYYYPDEEQKILCEDFLNR